MSCQLTILISQKVKRAVVFSFFQVLSSDQPKSWLNCAYFVRGL